MISEICVKCKNNNCYECEVYINYMESSVRKDKNCKHINKSNSKIVCLDCGKVLNNKM